MTERDPQPTVDSPLPGNLPTLGRGEAAPPADATFTSLPGYEILGELGRGGMGVVYKVRHLALNRVVALKMVLAGEYAGAVERARFRQEAETAARLQHPNIVQVYEVGAHQGHPFMALEFIDGPSLARAANGEPQPPREAARLVEAIARAAGYAHSQGVVHRDLTPANILLTSGGVPKVTDFGIARRVGGDPGLTATGAILGTPGYMSPEQAAGDPKAIGPPTDVYSLGAILYELLTGRPPFRGANVPETLELIRRQEPVPPHRLRADVPRDLETVCLKCLEKEPARRYPNAAELADDLHRFLDGRPVQARPVGPAGRAWRWARRNPGWASMFAVVVALLSVIAVGGAVLSLWLGTALHQSEEDRKQAEQDRKQAVLDRDAADAARLESRNRLLQSLIAEGRSRRFSRQPGQRFATLDAVREALALARELGEPESTFDELRNLAVSALVLPDLRPAPEWFADPEEKEWSTNGRAVDRSFRLLAVADVRGAVSIRTLGVRDHVREIARLPGFGGEARLFWSPDARFLAVWHWQRARRLQIWGVGGERASLALDVPDVIACDFSPDGRRVVTLGGGRVRVRDIESGREVRSFPAPAGAAQNLAHHPTLPRAVLLTPDVAAVVDLETGEEVDRFPTEYRATWAAWSPDGEMLGLSFAHSIHLWDVARRQRRELEHRGGGIQFAFDHSEEVLVSHGWAGRIKLWDPHTGRELFSVAGGLMPPFFGPGDRLAGAFTGRWAGRGGPLLRYEAGRESRSLVVGANLPGGVRDYWNGSLHPDGRLLAVGTEQGVGLLDLRTGAELAFLPARAHIVRFEPGGSLLVNAPAGLLRWPVRAGPADPNRLRVGPPELVPVPLSKVHGSVEVSADGAVLAAAAGDGGVVWRRDRPKEFVRLRPHPDCRNVAISPDGKLVATGSHSGWALKVWDAQTGRLVRELLPHVRWTEPHFSPDGRWLFNKDGESWRVADWSEGPRHPGTTAVCDPRMRFVAWAQRKGIIPLTDPETGKEIARLEDPYGDGLHEMIFSRDGSLLIGLTNDSLCVRVWDLRKVRAGLADLGLDWKAEPYPPLTEDPHPAPLRAEWVGADPALLSPPPTETPVNLNNRAWRLVSGPGRWDPQRALPLIRRALKADPDNPIFLHTYGGVLYRLRDYAGAAAALERGLKLDAGRHDAAFLYFLAMSHARMGDAAKARDCFDRAVRWAEGKKGLPPREAQELKEFRAEAEAVLRELPEPLPVRPRPLE